MRKICCILKPPNRSKLILKKHGGSPARISGPHHRPRRPGTEVAQPRQHSTFGPESRTGLGRALPAACAASHTGPRRLSCAIGRRRARRPNQPPGPLSRAAGSRRGRTCACSTVTAVCRLKRGRLGKGLGKGGRLSSPDAAWARLLSRNWHPSRASTCSECARVGPAGRTREPSPPGEVSPSAGGRLGLERMVTVR